jgi:hypothetical protein
MPNDDAVAFAARQQVAPWSHLSREQLMMECHRLSTLLATEQVNVRRLEAALKQRQSFEPPRQSFPHGGGNART